MRIPETPPSFHTLVQEAALKKRDADILLAAKDLAPGIRYRHWDKIKRLSPPPGMTHREWWLALKWQRITQYRTVPLRSVNDAGFHFALVDPIPEHLQQIDLTAGGSIGIPDQAVNPHTRDRYIVRSLIEESITSSQLEGAAVTRQAADEMIRSGRKPRDQAEQMILNNYHTMQEIRNVKSESLTSELVLRLHRLATDQTLHNPCDAGRLRQGGQHIDIGNDQGEVFHVPPPADQLAGRLAAMCDFANGKTPGGFLHPVIRSIVLHFWLAYDHPFVDGNGRTARALFYWSMLHYGYFMCEFISISAIILKAPARYGRAFLYTETDDNDLTYFVLYQLDVMRRAMDELESHIQRKADEIQALESRLRYLMRLNHRQQALISHALRHPGHVYTIESHQLSHGIVYQTARTDLQDLAERGLLASWKVGKRYQFQSVKGLERLLRNEPKTPRRKP